VWIYNEKKNPGTKKKKEKKKTGQRLEYLRYRGHRSKAKIEQTKSLQPPQSDKPPICTKRPNPCLYSYLLPLSKS